MFTHYRTKGFILKKEDRGENDRLLTIFTEDFGKLELLAKAERKIKSKLRAGLELFYLSEVEFIQGKSHKTLTDAIKISSFPGIKKDLGKLEIASRAVEILDKLVRGQEPDARIWNLLGEIFEVLDGLESKKEKLQLFYYYFIWNFFSILGYQLELHHCLFCQEKIASSDLFFSSREGGVICQKCRGSARNAKPIEADLVKILRIFGREDTVTLKRLKIEESQLKDLGKASNQYFLEVLEKTR